MPNSRNRSVLLGITLLIAAGLRMGLPGLTEYKADEARLYSLSLDMAEGIHFPLHGIKSSVGIPNFPLSVWVYSVPAFFWKHPYSPTLFTGLLNTLSVFGCWWVVRRYWGAQAALATAFMYAVSPWAVIYSRKIWSQNLLPLFVVVWAASGLLTFVEGRRRAAAIHILCLAIVAQIHLSGIALIPITALGLLLYRRHVNWRWIVAGIVPAVILGTPLAIHLISEGSPAMSDLAATLGGAAPISTASFSFTWMLSIGHAIHSLAGHSAFLDYLQTVPDITWVQWVWGGLIAIGSWWMVSGREIRIGTSEHPVHARRAGVMIILWLLGPALFFIWQHTPVYPHYFITTFPAQYIAAGVGMAVVLQHAHRGALSTAVWGTLLLSGVLQVWVLAVLLHFVGQRATPGGFGDPIGMKLAAVEKAAALVKSGATLEVLLVGEGSDPAMHEFPAVYGSLLRSVPHRFVNGNRSALRPIGPTTVLLQDGEFSAQRTYGGWSAKTKAIPMRSGGGELALLYLPQRSEDISTRAPFPTYHHLANGVTLMGYAPLPGDTLHWEIYWETGKAVAADYHFFNHLLDDNGVRVGQADAPTFSASQWMEGDQVVSYFSASPTPSARLETMRIGMYIYPAVENVPLLDDIGNPVSDGVTVGLKQIDTLYRGRD